VTAADQMDDGLPAGGDSVMAGKPLAAMLGAPMEVATFLQIAIAMARAVSGVHQAGLIHKDIKPANVLITGPELQVQLTGFDIASRLTRERQAPGPPEFIAGTLAYMAPEQTGRMNRSIDSRSDLYALGVTLYEMSTGSLPFDASDPMAWVHCHIARNAIVPCERVDAVPRPVSAIIMRLLAKTAEDRYQTAAGLESDLRRCLHQWESQQRIDDFPLGEHDSPDRLLIPEKLYGREREVEALLAAFNRIVIGGATELVLVSGYSGIGKSSVVNELHKALVPSRGWFASGKFDQYKRDVPYSTLAQAFQSLIRGLLVKSDAELASWRSALREALGPNAMLMVELAPELKHVIGEVPPVAELPAQESQRRFQLVFRRFISVFARPEHPLVLFLDDLQWLDAATLDLLEDLLIQDDVGHLMLIGAYRDNAVDGTHLLTRKLQGLRKSGTKMQEIVLAPLCREDVEHLVEDALRCEPERAVPLAVLLHEKTAGNPFFVIQFVSSLAEDRILRFDHADARWSWDLERIRARGYTANVADLMVAKLGGLSVGTREALQHLACLGSAADAALLATVCEESESQVHADLRGAVHADLVLHAEGAYRFLHDQVQEAAYTLIPEDLRPAAHLRIGRLLLSQTLPENQQEAIFDIVNQLGRGAALIGARDERERLADLYLGAGLRAKASSAYASALKYLVDGAALLADDAWQRRHELAFSLELHRAECEFLIGQSAAAEQRLTELSSRTADVLELATVTCLRVDLYTTLDRSDRAVAVCLQYLRHLGVEWSPHPAEQEVQREYARIWQQLEGREIEDLVSLPLMTDPVSLATLDVLTKVLPPALFTDANLLSLAICSAVNLSLERGNSDGSCVAYGWLGQIAGARFNNYKAGFKFGLLGYELVEGSSLTRFRPRVYMVFASHVMPWSRHVRTARQLIHKAFEIANENGDLSFAAYSRVNLNTNLLTSGDSLSDVQREAEIGLQFAHKLRFGFAIDIITSHLALVRTLRGSTLEFGCFDNERFEERQFECHLASEPRLAQPECIYWIRKLQARFLSADYASAVDASLHAQRLIWSVPSNLDTIDYHYYAALSHAALWDSASADQRLQHGSALAVYHQQLEVWAENCPENFETLSALVGAEIARIEGRELDAERLYEQAIRSARANSFVHNEAIAYERASAFYRARGLDQFAELYLRNARDAYHRWGADGKVRQLDERSPHLSQREREPIPTSTIGATVEHLDLATVIKVSQAVSGEIVMDKMLDTLMRTAIEHAGAERGLLVVLRGVERIVAAEATTKRDAVTVQRRDEAATATMLPHAVLHYVLRTHESLILDDAAAQNPFADDCYIQQQNARSILCLPLLRPVTSCLDSVPAPWETQGINHTKLIGVLYLENNLAPRVFAPARIAILKLLASQAAISLENTGLYHDLAERESKIRRLVEANIIGIFIYALEGRIVEANDAFLQMVGYDREDLVSGRIRWTDLTPPEWLDRDLRQWMPKLQKTGILPPFEKEYLRKDGSRVPVLIGVATFEEGGNEGVAFVLDLTERRRTEAERMKLQERLREAEKLEAIGRFASGIAHDFNNILGGIMAYGEMLFDEAAENTVRKRHAQNVLTAATRGRDLVQQILAYSRGHRGKQSTTDIGRAVAESIELLRGSLPASISLDVRLPSKSLVVLGDATRLHQVIMNLCSNAIHSMSEGGTLRIAVTPVDVSAERTLSQGVLQVRQYACLVAEDTGSGMDETALPRIFEPFFTTKEIGRGTGLGLALVYAIVTDLHGAIDVKSAPTKGSRFSIYLPLAESKATAS
jgi:PAS domain S-box-containing protein